MDMNKSHLKWPALMLVILIFIMSFQPEAPLRITTVFEYSKTDTSGYRIPALLTSVEGTLLAFSERRKGMHDHAQNDIVLRRSYDNGISWQPEQLIAEDGENSLNDPCAVVLESGRILLIFQRYPYGYHSRNSGWIKMADTGYEGPRTTKSFLVSSDDDGESWSGPREITRMIRPENRVSVGSPGRGIQLKNTEFRGRIIFPLYATIPDGKGDRTWENLVAYSDDRGETWSLSEVIPHLDTVDFGNEAQVVELSDGSLLFNARNQEGQYRKISRSRDGGISWDTMKLDPGLPGVNCMGSIINHHGELVYAGAANKKQRTNGTVRISTDNGETWVHSREVIPGSYAYSCMTTLKNGEIGLLYETDRYRRINFTSFSPMWIKEGKPEESRYFNIPVIDLDKASRMQVIVDREEGQYLGHPTTVLLEDNKTMICVYPKSHGRGAIVMKRSVDAGLTWSERLPTPASWETSGEVPTINRVVGPDGHKRLIMFSGLYPARMAVSEDDGHTWSELQSIGDWGGIVMMGCVIPLKTSKGHYMSLFHDDLRFFTEDGIEKYRSREADYTSRLFTLYKTISVDGGLSWSFPEAIYSSSEINLCEPGFIRSPDGNQMAVLLRENARVKNSHVIFSNDEGETWTLPRELPAALTGDRHVLRYAPDGRILASFRDVSTDRSEISKLARQEGISNMDVIASKYKLGSPTEGDWVAWVGTYQDILEGTEGQYRIRIKDNKKDWDTTYPGLELLPEGTFVITTYGHWEEGEQPHILSVRFSLEEMDRLVKK
jgi:hypothetical protein